MTPCHHRVDGHARFDHFRSPSTAASPPRFASPLSARALSGVLSIARYAFPRLLIFTYFMLDRRRFHLITSFIRHRWPFRRR